MAKKRVLKAPHKIPSAWQLTVQTVRQLSGYKGTMFKLLGWFVLLTLVLVSTSQILGNYQQVQSIIDGMTGAGGVAYAIGWLISTAGGVLNEQNIFAATVIFLVVSTATIYVLRQIGQQNQPRLKEAFYKGMFPLVPLTIALFLIAVQTLPLLITSTIYSTLFSINAAFPAWVQPVGLAIVIVSLVWTLLLLASALPAFYIACLPEVGPLQAYRTARAIVKGRRWLMVRKTGFIILLLLLMTVLILLPFLLFLLPATPVVALVLVLASIIIFHAYMYRLYTELIQ